MLPVLQKLGRAPFAPPGFAGDGDSAAVVVAAFPLRRLYEAALQFAFYAGAPGAEQEKFRIMGWTGGACQPFWAAGQIAKKLPNVPFRGAKRRGIPLFLGVQRKEIPRFARNDKPRGVAPQAAEPTR